MLTLEALSLAATIFVSLYGLQRLCAGASGSRGALIGAGALLICTIFFRSRSAPVGVVAPPIGASTRDGRVSSGACRSCHPAEYGSWHDSYHRSMTQVATPETVRAPASDVDLVWQGRHYRLFRRDDEFWARLPDPDAVGARAREGQSSHDVPEVERQIVMTTGSHHYQAYWVPGARGNELWQWPFVYHFESQRFIPRHDAFLQPPDDPVFAARWNSNCIQCHSVAGEPRHDAVSDRFDSRAAELGIACEACHGPGAEHIARHQSPVTRYMARRDGVADPSIVNPARLGAERASEVCGQCHSYFVPRDADDWWQTGFARSYRPGDALDGSRLVLDYERDLANDEALIDANLDSLFYADGTIRVGGREWNGLKRSACFERGSGATQLSCLSCHQMHGASPADQLGTHGEANSMCQSCHAAHVARPADHTHHGEASSGNQCVNCHMPYTTYALFKGIRSHRITSPQVEPTSGRALNACNLCHQDQSLAWTTLWLQRWYGLAPALPARVPAETTPEASPESWPEQARDRWSAAAVALLSGDAATRVILAYQLGWSAAQDISGRDWQAQLLAESLDDPYAAVRFVAHRSLMTLPGFEGYTYDFIADRPVRLEQQAEARRRASAARRGVPKGRLTPALPTDADGLVDRSIVQGLAKARDERPIRISE